ncbi:CHAT domain-containing protein [Streptomyces sp. NBC_00690]|uniref:CHAT domain-containing protein n=1 Tax=Streptomyces sp. NBC_00690 TaxID=2975808 RepID=UPI002E2D0E2A|nr:CHAT domain-containing protein [Streptomyces sp. NBC_00690]
MFHEGRRGIAVGNKAKAAVARRIVRYLDGGDVTGLGPDAEADVTRMVRDAVEHDDFGVTGEPEALWLALWLALCGCTAPGLPGSRDSHRAAAESRLAMMDEIGPSLVPPGAYEAIIGRGPLPEDHRVWAALAGTLLLDGEPGDLARATAAVNRYRLGAAGQGGVSVPVALALGELLVEEMAEATYEPVAQAARASFMAADVDSTKGDAPGDLTAGWEVVAAVLEAGIAPLAPGSAPRLATLSTLGAALCVLAGLDPLEQFAYRPLDERATAHLDRGLEVLWEAIAFLPENKEAVGARAQIANLLLHRHLNGSPHGEQESLDKAITQQGHAVQLAEEYNAHHKGVLYTSLAALLGHRAQLLDRPEDHTESLRVAQRAEVLTRDGDPEQHSNALACLGLAELGWFDRYGDAPLLDDSVIHLRAACTVAGHPSDSCASALQALAEALLIRHERRSGSPEAAVPDGLRLFGAATDLDEARACAETVVASSPSSPDDFGRLCVLSTIYLTAYRECSDPVLLNAAVRAAELTGTVPADHPSAAECHARWAGALAERHRLRPVSEGDGDLAEAIRQARLAVAVAPESIRTLYLHNLAVLVALRLQTVRSERDVRGLLTLHEDIVTATPADSRHLPGRLHAQQAALLQAARLLDDPGLLSDAVAVAARACALAGRNGPSRPLLLIGHALALCERAQSVLKAAGPSGPTLHAPGTATTDDDGGTRHLPGSAASAVEDPGPALTDAEAIGRAQADLSEAIRVVSLARDDAPAGSATGAWALTVLVRALLAQARAATDDTHRSLSETSDSRTEGTGTAPRRAVELIDQALGSPDSRTHLRRHELLLLRAEALLMPAEGPSGEVLDTHGLRAPDARAPGDTTPTPTSRALADLDEVAQADHARLPDRLVAAERSARLAMDLGDAAGAHLRYRLALDLLRRWITVGLSANDVRTLLGDWRMLGADAAAAAIADDDPTSALALLEDGRAVLWQRVLELRTDIDRVHDLDPALATRLRTSAAVLRTASLEAVPAVGPALEERRGHRAIRLLNPGTQQLQNAEVAWSAAVTEARRLIPGFLERPDPEVLCAGLPGPVAVVNASRHRCDVLLVDSGGVRLLPLRLGLEDVRRHTAVYLAAARTFEERASTSAAPLGVGVTGPFNRVLGTVTGWLWETVASPVLEALAVPETDGGGLRPRLWWCPTGPLALLPLHAAGRHTAPGESVIDRVVPSYTPTVAALAASAAAGANTAQPRMLAVLADRVDGAAHLPGADIHRALITACFPDATVLGSGQARSEQVLSQLPTHTLLHVMCHGSHDPYRPERSGLLLEDGVVPVSALAAERTDAAFVSLTACQTATLDPLTSDEVISVAGAMVFAGWRQTIATLWPVDAAETTAVTSLLYGIGLSPSDSPGGDSGASAVEPFTPDRAARQLHDAVLSRRSLTRAPQARLWAWAPYLHIGA